MSSGNRLFVALPLAQSFVLNHRGDDTRWNSFLRDNDWLQHTHRLTRVPVIDPAHVPPPRYWRGSRYQWARLRGVLAVLESCLDKKIPCGMVFDDSARFVEGGPARLERFLGQLPIDWKLLVFGGHHRHVRQGVPTKVDENVYRPFSVAAPCAFMWRGLPMLQTLYHFYLKSCASPAGPRDYCEVRRPDSRCIYVPDEWIFHLPDAASKAVGEEAANLWNIQWPQTIVAVLAHYRGGSSCVAGVLHHLGVSMGEKLPAPDRLNPRGYFECLKLHHLSERFFDQPSMARRLPSPQMIGLLRQWAYRRSLANPQVPVLGAKHPALCCMGDEIAAAWPNRRFLVVDRKHDDIVASILRTDWGWTQHEATINVSTIYEQRERFLSRCDPSEVLRIDYEQLLTKPRHEIQRIVEHLAINIAPAAFDAAVRHVAR